MVTTTSRTALLPNALQKCREVTRRISKSNAILTVAVAIVSVLYVSFALTPSHFSLTLRQLGYDDAVPILGESKPIRSDDFLVATALIRSAVLNQFGTFDAFSPYQETLKSFMALPLADWALIFKPQMWGFFLLPPPYALSLYYLAFYLSFFIGYALLLRRLGATARLSQVTSAILLFAQFTQVWWTQTAPVLSFAPWVPLIFLSSWRWYVRVPALTYATAVWVLGQLYPPTLIATAFMFAALGLAFARKDDALRASRVIGGLVGVALGAGIAVFYVRDLIPIMAATIYPGQRLSNGGGVPVLMIISQLLPHAATVDALPALRNVNQCEIGVVGSFVPLIILLFADYESLAAWWRSNRRAAIIWLCGLGAMLAWMLLPIPAAVGSVLLWDRVPPTRMIWGFGTLLILGLAIIASHIKFVLTLQRAALFAGLVVSLWFTSRLFWIEPGSEAAALSAHTVLKVGIRDLSIVVVIAAIVAGVRLAPQRLLPHGADLLLSAALVDLVLAYGLFNPVQSAFAIFRTDVSAYLQAAKTLAAANPKGWVAVPGVYGHAFQAFGVRAINNVLSKPELAFFRKLYPEMPEAELQMVFNRYAHIVPSFTSKPSNPQPDVALVPIFDVGTPVEAKPADVAQTSAGQAGFIDHFSTEPAGPDTIRVIMSGWAQWRGVSAHQTLLVSFGRAEIQSLRAIRLPRTDVGAALHDKELDTSGFALEALVHSSSVADLKANVSVSSRDADSSQFNLQLLDR